MQTTLLVLAITLLAITIVMLIITAIMFFVFNIPTLIKDSSGQLEQKQIEEIRKKNYASAQQKGKVNVFEELEKKAKIKKANTHSLNVGTTTSGINKQPSSETGTSVLTNSTVTNKDFIIEKNIVFVSTYEVI